MARWMASGLLTSAVGHRTLAAVFLKTALKHSHQRAGTELFGHGAHILQALRLAEGAHKTAALHPRPPQHAPLGENNRPGNQAEDQKNK